MAFQIVRKISSGKRGIEGRVMQTLQAIVNFGSEKEPTLTTRHLHLQYNSNGRWAGWNSDRTLRVRTGILETHETHQTAAKATETRVADLHSKLNGLKGKRGAAATAERKYFREKIKAAKATLATANTDLARVKAIADRVHETHPEIVEFE